MTALDQQPALDAPADDAADAATAASPEPPTDSVAGLWVGVAFGIACWTGAAVGLVRWLI